MRKPGGSLNVGIVSSALSSGTGCVAGARPASSPASSADFGAPDLPGARVPVGCDGRLVEPLPCVVAAGSNERVALLARRLRWRRGAATSAPTCHPTHTRLPRSARAGRQGRQQCRSIHANLSRHGTSQDSSGFRRRMVQERGSAVEGRRHRTSHRKGPMRLTRFSVFVACARASFAGIDRVPRHLWPRSSVEAGDRRAAERAGRREGRDVKLDQGNAPAGR